MALGSLGIPDRLGLGPSSPAGPFRPPQPRVGPTVPMPGPGTRETVGARAAEDGIFGGSLSPNGGVEPAGRPDRRSEPTRDVVVLLPALNEEKGVGCVIDRIPRDRLRRAGYRVRVWVVDGKSTDATLEVARRRGASTFVQTGDGKGNGVRQLLDHLIAEARAPATPPSRVFIMLDADGSYPPEQIPEFVETLESG